MQPIIANTMAYAAFDRLLSIWNPQNSPRPKSFIPFSFEEWLSNLHHAKNDFQKELRDNWIKFDEGSKLDYLEEIRTQLDTVIDAIAALPTATAQPIKLRQVLKGNKNFPHSDTYKRLIDSLSAREQEASGPQRDETAAVPFQNEAVQADFFEVYQLVVQRLATVKREAPDDKSVGKQRYKQKTPPPIKWNAGAKDLLDLILTLQEKNHITIVENDKRKLSQAITSLFELPHSTDAPESEDWEIFRPYLATIQLEKGPNKTRTETHPKRAKKSLYKGVEPFKGSETF